MDTLLPSRRHLLQKVSTLLFGLLLAAGVAADTGAREAARQHRDGNGHRILTTYAELLRLPNVASDREGIRRNVEFIRSELEDRGVKVAVWEVAGSSPLIYGELDAPESESRRTLGIYAHYDGQPVVPERWSTPGPWKPTLYTAALESGGEPRPFPTADEEIDSEWRIYARSSGDDKAPIMAILAALDALESAGIPRTADLRFLFDGEEEIGSPHLEELMRTHTEQLSGIDGWLICDGPVHQSRRPQLVFGVRGYTGLDLTVYGATRYLHSGHYGNWAPNPALELAHLLAELKDPEGRVKVGGFYESTRAPGPAERRALDALPEVDSDLRRELGLSRTEGDGGSLAERLLLPSLNIRGMESGKVGDAARNVIPPTATASLDIRLVKGNDPARMLDRVEDHLRRQGYRILRDEPTLAQRLEHPKLVRVDRREGYPAARTPMDTPFSGWVVKVTRSAVEDPLVLLPTLGGSLPLYLFDRILGQPLVVVPIANHDDNQHAPDENLRLANLWYGIDLMADFFAAE
ncbi:MAG: M20/M25/M40 family metallo-hydrolase [Thermoanaerobaculia bacterium]|nr:M20/M25/M40 family metallo-hydrolase [Thermoanaerobaculia bacterium]